MRKAAVIGDRQSIFGFRALGLQTVEASEASEAAAALHMLASQEYAIIYVTEQLASQIQKDIDKYLENSDISVIMIPSKDGSLGIGMSEMHRAVERAVGADILKSAE